jgi:hypothetical protein
MKILFRGMAVALVLSFTGLLYGQNKTTPVVLDKDDNCPAISLKMDWASKYVYNGQVFNNQAVMLGDLCLEFQGFYVGVWGAYDLTHFHSRKGFVGEDRGMYDSERKWRFEEVDYYAGYYYTFDDVAGLGPVTVDFSWTYFHYPTVTECNSADLQLSVSLDELYKTDRQCVSTKLTGSHDYKLEETWVSLGGAYKVALDDDSMFELVLNGDVYWGDTKYMRNWLDCDGNGFSFAVVGVALNINAGEHFIITPYLNASCALDGRARDWTRKDEDYGRVNGRRNYWGGLKANLLF